MEDSDLIQLVEDPLVEQLSYMFQTPHNSGWPKRDPDELLPTRACLSLPIHLYVDPEAAVLVLLNGRRSYCSIKYHEKLAAFRCLIVIDLNCESCPKQELCLLGTITTPSSPYRCHFAVPSTTKSQVLVGRWSLLRLTITTEASGGAQESQSPSYSEARSEAMVAVVPVGLDTSTVSVEPSADPHNCLSPHEVPNTHNSILNITEDDDDDDEDGLQVQKSHILFPELQRADIPQTPDASHPWCEIAPPSSEVSRRGHESVLDSVTERLALCFPSQKDVLSPCHWPAPRVLEYDLLELLGCVNPPTAEEMTRVWTWNKSILYTESTSDPAPRRQSLEERALRVHRIRNEQTMPSVATKLYNPATPSLRSRSMNDYGKPQWISSDEGYDSDPEIRPPPPTHLHLAPRRSLPATTVAETVAESWNLHWTLTWHTNKTSHRVSAWLERGTILGESGLLLEPNLMWRHVHQEPGRQLNESSKKPYTIRMLNICRILPMTSWPNVWARPDCLLVVRTVEEEEYVLEAASVAERNDVVRRWKLTVARFASMAVTEDLDGIYEEFVHQQAIL